MKRIVAVLLLAASPAFALENLTEVISDVIEAPGMTAAQIADRGAECLKSAAGNAAEVVDPARDGDTAYAVVRIEYSLMIVKNMVRNRVSVIGKEGRFKIASTDIEYRMDSDNHNYKYNPLPKIVGSGWKKAETELRAYHAAVASCITQPKAAPGGDDW